MKDKAGNAVRVDVGRFVNDIHEINSRDAVLTLLIHLGYLSYDDDKRTVRIPNYEVQQEFERTIQDGGNWGNLAKLLNQSERPTGNDTGNDGGNDRGNDRGNDLDKIKLIVRCLNREILRKDELMHKHLGPFLNEYMYQDALAIELSLRGIPFQRGPSVNRISFS